MTELLKKEIFLEKSLRKKINEICSEPEKIGVQYFVDKEFEIQETGEKLNVYIEFLFIYGDDVIKIFRRKKDDENFILVKEIERNDIQEIWRISNNSKVLLVELKNKKFTFIKEKSRKIYYNKIKLKENYVICTLKDKNYLCNLNNLNIIKNFVINKETGNFIELIEENKPKTKARKIEIILTDKSFLEIEDKIVFLELNIVAVKLKNSELIFIKTLKGEPIISQGIKTSLKSFKKIEVNVYNKSNETFKYIKFTVKEERNSKRDMGGDNKTKQKLEYLIFSPFDTDEHIIISVTDLVPYTGNIDNLTTLTENMNNHIEYIKTENIFIEKEDDYNRHSFLIVSIFKKHKNKKNILKIYYMQVIKIFKIDIRPLKFTIQNKEDIDNLKILNHIKNIIYKIYDKYI